MKQLPTSNTSIKLIYIKTRAWHIHKDTHILFTRMHKDQ
jgi:hypothetical protein